MSRRNSILGGILNPLHLSPALFINFGNLGSIVGTTTPGSSINGVNDLSGNGYHFSQAIAANRPTIQFGANGIGFARFDGVNDELLRSASNLVRNVSGATIYVSRRWTALPGTGRTVFDIIGGASSVRAGLRGSGTGKNRAAGRTIDANPYSNITGTSDIVPGSWKVQTGVFDYANTDLHLYVDGVLDGSNTGFNVETTTSNTASAAAAIGSQYGAAFFNGDIAHVLVFHTAHDASTRARVRGWIAANLPT